MQRGKILRMLNSYDPHLFNFRKPKLESIADLNIDILSNPFVVLVQG